MPTFSGSRKRQARLAFTPLPSSSPAAKEYNPQIQDRAAAVRYGDEDSPKPAKRRKLQSRDNMEEEITFVMPTPAASLPQLTAAVTEDSDDEPVRSAQRNTRATAASRKRTRQQRLYFDNAPQSINIQSPVTADRGEPAGSATHGTGSASSDESDELPSPSKLTRQSKSKSSSSKKSSKSDGFMGSGAPRVTRSSRKQTQDADDSEDNVVVRSAPKSQTVHISEDEGSEDDEEQMPTTLGTQRQKREWRSSFISSSPPAAVDSDDDLQIVEDPRKERKAQTAANEDDEDDEGPLAATPGRRKLARESNFTQQEQEELDEDLDFLGPSSDVDGSSRRPRNSQSSQKSARLKALDRLKQKRSSQRALPEISEGNEDGSDKEDGAQSDYGSDYSEDQQAYAPTSSRAMFAADEEDEDFLVEEGEDDALGIPDGIPLQFTRYASMKAKELFKFAVEWMVQKKINPAFPGDDEVYTLTFKKLDDEVRGLVSSKFSSSAWTSEFTIAIRSRPVIAFERLDRNMTEHMFRDKCDACNRTGHPATYQVQLQKKPYERDTLDEVGGQDEDEDDEDDSSSSGGYSDVGDHPDYDANGNEVAPANKIWYLGKFCMSNAQTAHALQHWRLHLYEWVVEWIDNNGYSSAEKLKKRDRMSTKKRRKYANKIVDLMDQEGVVKKLWKEFRSTIDDAAISKQGRFGVESP